METSKVFFRLIIRKVLSEAVTFKLTSEELNKCSHGKTCRKGTPGNKKSKNKDIGGGMSWCVEEQNGDRGGRQMEEKYKQCQRWADVAQNHSPKCVIIVGTFVI